jgi:hypothetical protein
MQQSIIFFITLCLSTSCATMMNKDVTIIRVKTTEPSKIVLNSDTFKTKKNRFDITVPRSKATLQLTILTDSLKKSVSVKSRNSFEYYSNIFCNYGIGLLVDKNNLKRYDYPSPIYVNLKDTINQYFRYDIMYHTKKGGFYWHFSFPHVNFFTFKPQGESIKLNTGFMGFSTGFDYFYAKNRYLNLSESGVMDFFLPFPGPIRYDGEWEFMESAYLSLSNNYKIKQFSVGYGFSYAKNRWAHRNFTWDKPEPPSRENAFASHNAIGFVLNAYFQIGKTFNLGLIYRPTFIRFGATPTFQYEHLMSLDLAWKIRLKK